MNANLFAAFANAFPADRESVAIEVIDPATAQLQRNVSWAALDALTAQFANLLDSLRLPAQARVAVQTAKSVEAYALYLAVLRAGYVYLPLNTAYQATEIEYFVGNAEPSVFVCAPEQEHWIQPIAARYRVAHVFTLGADGDSDGSLLAHASAQSSVHAIAPKAASDLATILYTSGTTGRSKGAMLTHGNLLANAMTLKDFWGWSRQDVLIHVLPIFHVHGLFISSHCALLSGAKMLWLSRFEPETVIQLLPRATIFMGVPTLYVRLLAFASLTAQACRNMRMFVAGSAPLLVDTFDAFAKQTGHTIVERYGMSESNVLCSNPFYGSASERRGGTVGKPLPGVGVRVRGESGTASAVDEIGGIEVTGPNVFAGYWRMPEKTQEEFTSDGWFKTGDVGKIDEQGYLTIVGRSKDLIISGGYNVYPAEIEGYINALSGVAESAVIGVPHPDFGEAVVAVVTARADSEIDASKLVLALKAQIAGFKVPKRVFVVNELPRNTMGKVQKNLLRQAHRHLFDNAAT